MEDVMKKLLNDIVNLLETQSVAIGRLEKTCLPKDKDVVDAVGQDAKKDVRDFFDGLRRRVNALPED
jgi:hypothetical protein